ncbi:MAG: helix-turn-helix domain-containing protein [Oleibacter sp.]|nr:helix-turn-helix domain-containing protein [Thalassolituus sp.]
MNKCNNNSFSVSVEMLVAHKRAVEMYLRDQGTHDELLDRFSNQLNLLAIYDPTERISIEVVSRNIEMFASWLKEPNLGLKIAPYSTREQRRLAFFYSNDVSLLDYFRILVRYICISSEVMRFEISVDESEICLEMIPNSPTTVSIHQTEGFFASICDAVKQAHGVVPEVIEFTHINPTENLSLYQSILGVIPKFQQTTNRMFFRNLSRDTLLSERKPSVRSLQLIQSMEAVKRLEVETESWNERCRFLLRILMYYGEPSKIILAELLAVTPRTLQRHLDKEGQSFRYLLSDLRKELAAEYLKNSKCTCEDVAFLLGYKDVGQFYRVFRTWYSKSPGQFRADSG